MSEQQPSMKPGSILSVDLTVNDAPGVRDFYQGLVGWESTPVNMGDYDDFVMLRGSSDERVAGICHARGVNQDLPPIWMIYIIVADINATVAQCAALGGKVIRPPSPETGHALAVLQDPAGAIFTVYQPQ